MRRWYVVVAALVAAVALTAVTAAGAGAAKQRVALTVTILPVGEGLLEPLQGGAVKRDTGTFGGDWSRTPDRTVTRDGQTVDLHSGVWTFTGKRGTLVFRERNEWVDVGNGHGVATGTWKVLRGTGAYGGLTGGGRSGHAGPFNGEWVARYEGLLTRS